MREPRRLVFLHPPAHHRRGSKLMRCDQLADAVAQAFPDRFEIAIRPVIGAAKPRRQRLQIAEIRDSLVVLSKGMVTKLSDGSLAMLAAQGNRVAVDYVDNTRPPRDHPAIAIHITASHRAVAAARAALPGGRVRYLRHHFDPRLSDMPPAPQDAFRPLYVGHPMNRLRIAPIEAALVCHEMDDDGGFEAALADLGRCNFHYNVRPADDVQRAKPFTKGFTAAACGANLIVQHQVDGALEYLGADYPYLVPSDEEADIWATWQRAADGVGSAEWARGLEIMRGVRDLASPARIARDFVAILDELADT